MQRGRLFEDKQGVVDGWEAGQVAKFLIYKLPKTWEGPFCVLTTRTSWRLTQLLVRLAQGLCLANLRSLVQIAFVTRVKEVWIR